MAEPDDRRSEEDGASRGWSTPFHAPARDEEQPQDVAEPGSPMDPAPHEVTAASTPLAATADDEPAGAVDEAPPPDAVDEPAAPMGGLSPIRRLLGNAALAWLVAGAALLGLVGFAIAAVPALNAERERAEVRDRAEVVALRVTTFEGQTIEEWVAETRALATGEYAQQLDDVFDQELRDALRENEVESVGTVQRSFVQSLEGDRAEVFVLARQTSVNAQREEPVEDELRIEIGLQRVDGEWLASDIAVLGPQQAAPVPDADGQVDVDEEEDQ